MVYKEAKLRSNYRQCDYCGGTGTASAATDAAAHRTDIRMTAFGFSGDTSRAAVKPGAPMYRPADDPNAADPFVEDPFSGFVPLRWKEARDRQSYGDPAAERELASGEEELLVYNAGYMGRENDHRIWLVQDDNNPDNEQHADRCGQCDGAGVVRVEWTASLSLAPAFILLGVACCAAAYTEKPLLTAGVYGAVMLIARFVRFKSERYFVTCKERFAAKRKPVRYE